MESEKISGEYQQTCSQLSAVQVLTFEYHSGKMKTLFVSKNEINAKRKRMYEAYH